MQMYADMSTYLSMFISKYVSGHNGVVASDADTNPMHALLSGLLPEWIWGHICEYICNNVYMYKRVRAQHSRWWHEFDACTFVGLLAGIHVYKMHVNIHVPLSASIHVSRQMLSSMTQIGCVHFCQRPLAIKHIYAYMSIYMHACMDGCVLQGTMLSSMTTILAWTLSRLSPDTAYIASTYSTMALICGLTGVVSVAVSCSVLHCVALRWSVVQSEYHSPRFTPW